ncbi:hypothetical protein K402DRAFT_391328 [Aulographum hederae CBS 113979]|uniref:UBZ4-type domain-containing protein n=1 Tax=Aulographum hederae CBS 113979 TaxID=1176131 RepID=A0A6G1H7I2_9PEZI|nr:hypothetical protein K402DRAFT_391328 [Aulographum hederae CBS 113979]
MQQFRERQFQRSRGRGRGRFPNRGRSGRGDRGGTRNQSFSENQSHNPPTLQQVIPGAHVSIVLKMDQSTGHQVQGIVAEVLTNGNHPRGIKVRLQDGRVGRVQRMATEDEARTGSEGLSNLGRNGEPSGSSQRGGSSSRGQVGRASVRYTDFRNDGYDYDPPPSNSYSLADFLPPDDPPPEVDRSERNATWDETDSKSGSATGVCPVCHEFEGDEEAVAHHVSAHFD